MKDLDPILDKLGPGPLRQMLELPTRTEEDWDAIDLGAMLQHQLDQELVADVCSVSPNLKDSVTTGLEELQDPPRTHRELLLHASPPVDILTIGKGLAKSSRKGATSSLPPDLAAYLYFACIACAMVRCRAKISSLSDPDLLKGFRWCFDTPWGDPAIQALLNEAIQEIQ